MSLGDMQVALVHDELTRRGGAEHVFEELAGLFPRADLYTLYAGEPRMIIDGVERMVTTSFLQRLPLSFRKHPARVLPLLPPAAEQFDLSSYDIVISSASGFAKSLVTRVSVPHLCYCHTPTRYLWEPNPEAVQRVPHVVRWPARMLFHYLRLADYAAAQRVDSFIANSHFTQRRITNYYRRSSRVVYPPIDTTFFTPASQNRELARFRRPYFLVVGRLTQAKRFDQAIRVCEKMELPLLVIGTGSERRRLERMAGKQTRFLGRVSQSDLRDYLRGARALLQPGEEDFGMAAAEALACGTPVVAYQSGGSSEVVEHFVTGLLYRDQREEALAESLRHFLLVHQRFRPGALQQSVLRFARSRFAEGIQDEVARLLDRGYSKE